MPQAYSDPKRADDPHALPDVEVFFVSPRDYREGVRNAGSAEDQEMFSGPGWYWWPCFPGCLPDSDPVGPFATEAEALADAQSDAMDDAQDGAQ